MSGAEPASLGSRRLAREGLAARLMVATLAALLAACSPTTPSATPAGTGAPSTAAPGASAMPGATSAATPAPSPVVTPSPAPTAAGAGWAAVSLPPAPADASLTPVSGSAYAVDPAAGFRLVATADVALPALLARLRVEPAMAYLATTAADGRSAVLQPTTPLRPGSSFRFTLVDAGGTPLTGWAFQVAGPPRVVGTLPASERTDVPVSTGIEITFDQDGVAVRRGDITLRVVPEGTIVGGAVEMHGRAAVFVPAAHLAAGRAYQVTVRAGTGATSRNGGLSGDLTFSFQTARLARQGSVEAELGAAFYTSLPGERALVDARQWRNAADGEQTELHGPVPVRVYRLAGEAAAIRALERLLRVPSWADASARPVIPTTGLPVVLSGRASFAAGSDEGRLRLPVATRAGWYLVELRDTSVSQAVLQVTDVEAMAGVRADHIVAWVNDGRTGRPVAGAAIDLVGGARLGRTDARGVLVARTPGAIAASTGPVLLRLAARDGRRVIVQLAGDAGLKGRGEGVPWNEPGLAAWWSALSMDRWLYRSTDTISAWGYLRTRAGDRTASSITVRVRREVDGPSVGRPLTTVAATRAPTGAWIASVSLRDLPYGSYVLEVVADGRVTETGGFEVGDLRKPPYELGVAAAPRAVTVGDPITATVTGRFFEGTPAAGIPVAVRLDEDPTEATVRGTTGTDGTAVVTLRPDPFGSDSTSQSSCQDLVVRPDTGVEGYVEGRQAICVFRGLVYVDVSSVRNGSSMVVSGAVHRVDLARVETWLRDAAREDREMDPRGAGLAGQRVQVAITETLLRRVLTRRWYDPITKQVVETYDWVDGRSTTTTRTAITGADGTFRLRLPAAGDNRQWNVSATVVDSAGHRVQESTWTSTQVAAREAPYYNVGLKGDRTEYGVGDTVTAVVQGTRTAGAVRMPTGGSTRYLFLVTGPTRFDVIVSRTPQAGVRFRASDEPNLHVEAVWFTGRGFVLPGGAAAVLRTSDRRIDVALETDRTRYEPGATATVSIRTTDRAGRPVRASVLLRGVDQKLLAMGAAGFDDPISLLYQSLPVELLSGPVVSHEVRFRSDDGKGSTGGGGGGGRTEFRDDLPLQMVTTGADGRATATFHLPDDITGWRVAATAITANRRAGATTVLLPVGLPFFADATIAPEYLTADRVSIRLRAFGSALVAGTPVRFTVSSPTLGMAPVTVDGTAFSEVLVALPALTPGTQRVAIAATSSAGTDRLERTFRVVESRLAAGHSETVSIGGSIAPPGGPGLTRLVLADAGRARYVALLEDLATPRGQRSDELLAAAVARRILVEQLGQPADDLPPAVAFARSTYQARDGGLAILPYGSSDLELTVRALVADPGSLLADSVRPWLRAIADDRTAAAERRVIARVGLAALGEPVLASLATTVDDPTADGRTRLWAALGLAMLGDRGRAATLERALLARWGERRGDQVRLRIGDGAEAVSEATELLALLAAWVGDPIAADALAYVTTVPPLDDLATLAQVSVVGKLIGRLAAQPAVVAVVANGERTTIDIPAGRTVTLEVLPAQRVAMRLEPVSGAAAVTASWEEPAPTAAALGADDPDLALARTVTPASPIAANSLVHVRLDLHVAGPGRTGAVDVVDVLPSGLVALEGEAADGGECGAYEVAPARIEGQRVIFAVTFQQEPGEDGSSLTTVPGTFCLRYLARVVTAGTYAWQPAVARQVASPGLVATTPAGSLELR